jgi:hypothetical protein
MTAPKNLIQPSENPEVETIRDKRTAFWDEWRGAVRRSAESADPLDRQRDDARRTGTYR